jgi:hypothetical protein
MLAIPIATVTAATSVAYPPPMLLSNAMGRTLFAPELPVTLPTSDEITPPRPPLFVVVVAVPVMVAAAVDPPVVAAPTETEMVAAAAPVGTGCPS